MDCLVFLTKIDGDGRDCYVRIVDIDLPISYSIHDGVQFGAQSSHSGNLSIIFCFNQALATAS